MSDHVPMQNEDARTPRLGWDALFFAAAIGMALLLRPPYLTDWDSFDYTVAAVDGTPSTLATGRMYFVGLHALVWRAAHFLFDVPPQDAWRVLAAATIVLGGLAAAAMFRAGYWLTRSRLAAVLTATLWVASPQAMVYAGAVMTETPTILLFAAAIVLIERSARRGSWRLAAAAGAAFAVAANMREPLVCFGLYFLGRTLLAPRRSWRLRVGTFAAFAVAFVVVYAGGVALAAWRLGGLDRFMQILHGWVGHMAEEREEISNLPIRNARFTLMFALQSSPLTVAWLLVALPMLVVRLFRRRPAEGAAEAGPEWGPLAWLTAGSAAYLFSLLTNHDTPVNPRFALPLMMPLMPLVAAAAAWTIRSAVGRRPTAWLAALAVASLGIVALAALLATHRLCWWVRPYLAGRQFEAWAMAALVAAGVVALIRAAVRASAPIGRLAAAAGVAVLVGAFILLIGLNWLNDAYWNYSRWEGEYAKAVMAAGAMPEDAMLIPGPATPVVQYLLNIGAHDGWIVPGRMSAEEAAALGEHRGWVVIASGWIWPDGRNGKPELLDLVNAYLAAGKPVYVYAGPSSWKPEAMRHDEWPAIDALQRAHAIGPLGPGRMARVLPQPPPPGAELVPLGRGQRERSAR